MSSGSCVSCLSGTKYDDKNPKILCHGCNREFCVKCSGLLATELRVIILQNPKLKFLCTECEEGLLQVPVLRKKVHDLEEAIEKIKGNQNTLDCESTINEINEREKRSKNIIIFGVNESESTDLNERKEYDKNQVVSIVSQMVPNIDLNKSTIIRLGKPDSKKPRPLRVTLKNKEQAVEVFRGQKKKPKKGIKIRNDLTVMQRENLQRLREQLVERQANGETDITIKYVRGIPGIFNIPKNQ